MTHRKGSLAQEPLRSKRSVPAVTVTVVQKADAKGVKAFRALVPASWVR